MITRWSGGEPNTIRGLQLVATHSATSPEGRSARHPSMRPRTSWRCSVVATQRRLSCSTPLMTCRGETLSPALCRVPPLLHVMCEVPSYGYPWYRHKTWQKNFCAVDALHQVILWHRGSAAQELHGRHVRCICDALLDTRNSLSSIIAVSEKHCRTFSVSKQDTLLRTRKEIVCTILDCKPKDTSCIFFFFNFSKTPPLQNTQTEKSFLARHSLSGSSIHKNNQNAAKP